MPKDSRDGAARGILLMIRDQALKTVACLTIVWRGNSRTTTIACAFLRGLSAMRGEEAFVFHYGGRTFLGMGLTDDKWRALIHENEQTVPPQVQVRPEERLDAALESKRFNAAANAPPRTTISWKPCDVQTSHRNVSGIGCDTM